ncbi:MAG TPA: hypothetical protein VFX98_12315 [Longimicrobiaceae bacterium]|nr:hypothetical protein [Longimicrobiaceae bacterium]
MSRSRTLLLPLLVGAAALAACADDPSAPQAARTVREPSLQVSAPDPRELASRIPAFGGYYLDRGIPTVWVTEQESADEAVSALEGFARSRGVARGAIRVRLGGHSYTELADWFDRATPVLALDGVISTDLDEAENTVTIGVDNPGRVRAVTNLLRGLGIPEGVVRIRQADPIYTTASLRDQVRPVTGGLQINYGNYVCTLGFNALHSQGASYITNSHCTGRQGGVQGTVHYQSLASQAGSRIGVEVADPVYATGGSCPKGKTCRFSDSSRGLYDAGVLFSLGRVARTTSSGNLTGSLTIDASNPFLTITGKGSPPVVGQSVSKVGRTSGWTTGNVTNTCVNTSVQGSKVMLYCQTFVAAGVLGGDSGSPVFTGSGNVSLVGILWGGNSAGNSFVMSPIGQVEQELGSLTVN